MNNQRCVELLRKLKQAGDHRRQTVSRSRDPNKGKQLAHIDEAQDALTWAIETIERIDQL